MKMGVMPLVQLWWLLLAVWSVTGAAEVTDVEAHMQEKLQQARSLLQSGVCKHVYLDVGTNRGVQLRKLFEPEFYPGAGILQKFDKYFGTNRDNVCAFGFEPNVVHHEWLTALEKVYRKRGQKVVIFTTTAVSTSDGTAEFFRGMGKHKEEVGASLLNWKEGSDTVTVALLNLAQFMNGMVHQRVGQRPDSKVLMKMDIEGAEYDVVAHLLASGALCRTNEAMIEWHKRKVPGASKAFPDFVGETLSRSKNCPCVFGKFDDETYARDNRPLPSLRRE